LNKTQKTGFCGPASLSYVVFLLTGKDIDQSSIARSVHGWKYEWRVRSQGMGPEDLGKAARKQGISEEVIFCKKYDEFKKKMLSRLDMGCPAVMCVDFGDVTHWLTVTAYDKKGYYVCDPDNDDELFSIYGDSDAKSYGLIDDDKHPGYFALSFHRTDMKPPAFVANRRFLELLDDESYADIMDMRDDLQCLTATLGGKGPAMMASSLIRIKPIVMAAMKRHIDWDEAELDADDISRFYDDYITVAASTLLTNKKKINDAVLVAEMTTILNIAIWNGGF
jgi:hypothetical protein